MRKTKSSVKKRIILRSASVFLRSTKRRHNKFNKNSAKIRSQRKKRELYQGYRKNICDFIA